MLRIFLWYYCIIVNVKRKTKSLCYNIYKKGKIWKIKCFVFNVKKQQDVQDVQNLEYVENHQI